MMEVCGDGRFEIIEKAKQAIIESTNIETSPEEMAVLDNILFRCWQMGWLDKYGNQPSVDGDLISREMALAEFRDRRDVYDIMESIEELPSAPDSRQRGEWVRLEREENVHDLHGVPTWGVNYMCDKCGFITTAIQDHFAQYRWCPSCGARMYKGGEEE